MGLANCIVFAHSLISLTLFDSYRGMNLGVQMYIDIAMQGTCTHNYTSAKVPVYHNVHNMQFPLVW